MNQTDIEFDILGIAFIGNSNGTLEKIFSLNADHFQKPEHREIFRATKALHRDGIELNTFKTTSALKQQNIKPKLLVTCLDILARIPKDKDYFELQTSRLDSFIERLKDNGASSRNIVIAHPAYEVNCEFLTLGFREIVIVEDKPTDRNFYIISHDDKFTLHDSNILQLKNRRFIFDERERLLVRHQDRWNKELIQTFVDNPKSPTGVYVEIKTLLNSYVELPKEETAGFIAAWIRATYFHQLFYSFPFLFIYGKRGAERADCSPFWSVFASMQ